MIRRALVLSVLLVVAACAAGPERPCSNKSVPQTLSVVVEPEVRATLSSMLVELCQGDQCATRRFDATSPQATSRPATGVTAVPNRFDVSLPSLDLDLDPSEKVELTVVGRVDVEGEQIDTYRRVESRELVTTYPNGKKCDRRPFLSLRTTLGIADRIGDD